MNTNQLPPSLDQLHPPEPPPGLRRMVLDPALQAMTRPPIRDRWTTLWENHTLRLVWITCVLALIVGHLAASLRFRPTSTQLQARSSSPQPLGLGEFDAVQPLRLDARPLTGWETAAELAKDEEAHRSTTRSNPKEKS